MKKFIWNQQQRNWRNKNILRFILFWLWMRNSICFFLRNNISMHFLLNFKLVNKTFSKCKNFFLRQTKVQTGVNPIKIWFIRFFRFLLLSLSVCSIRKYCMCYKMAKLNSKKRKKIFILRRKKFGRIDSWCRIFFHFFSLYFFLSFSLTDV